MSECETCGRPDDGHWVGCAEASQLGTAYDWNGGKEWNPLGGVMKALTPELMCTHEGCEYRRRSDDKRVKFCEIHSDPKNRK